MSRLRTIFEQTSDIHVKCKSSYLALHKIGQIRNLLDKSTTEKLVHAFITSRLDFCNSLLLGLPDSAISKLQRVQNSAARLVTRSKTYDHISPIFSDLHQKSPLLIAIYTCLLGLSLTANLHFLRLLLLFGTNSPVTSKMHKLWIYSSAFSKLTC